MFPRRIYPVTCIHSINLIWLSDYQLFQICQTSVSKWDHSLYFWWNVIIWVILSHEYRCFQCWRHKLSHIKERLSMSCIVSFEKWSSIFRNRSFTLCKNDRDFSERFDSVAVPESISSSSMTNLFVSWVNCCPPTGLPVLAPNITPDFYSWEDHFSSMFHSE